MADASAARREQSDHKENRTSPSVIGLRSSENSGMNFLKNKAKKNCD